MSKKHFIALADGLRANRPEQAGEARCQWDNDVAAIANRLVASCPRFNRQRWLSYVAGECGPNGGTVRVNAGDCGDGTVHRTGLHFHA